MSIVSLAQLRIVVAEDNPHMRRIVGAMLGGFGCRRIESAGNGEKALRIIGACAADLIIANMHMPVMDGLALTRRLRDPELSDNPFQPIILLTASSDPKHVIAARDAGANEFLLKPLKASTFYRTICATLETTCCFVKTKTYFGPDRRRNSRRQSAPYPPREILIGDRVVQDFSGDNAPLLRRAKYAKAFDAA